MWEIELLIARHFFWRLTTSKERDIATSVGLSSERARTLQQQAYDYVRARIMNLELKPGESVTDGEIAGELDVSRTPVREALRRLEQEGLLVHVARRGWKVYSLSLRDVHEIFDVIEGIVGITARRAAACTDERLRTVLRESVENMRAASEADDIEAWRRADHLLHKTVFDMAGNERAARIYFNTNAQWARFRVHFYTIGRRIQRSTPEHVAIVERVLVGDEDEAERLIREHIANLGQDVKDTLANLVLPFVQDGV